MYILYQKHKLYLIHIERIINLFFPRTEKIVNYAMYRHVVECFKSSQSQLELMSIILITKVYLGILVTKISNDFKMTKSKNTVDIIEKHRT